MKIPKFTVTDLLDGWTKTDLEKIVIEAFTRLNIFRRRYVSFFDKYLPHMDLELQVQFNAGLSASGARGNTPNISNSEVIYSNL